jgi:hypothetical protein
MMGEAITISDADAMYEIMTGYGVYGYIRAVVPFTETTFNGKSGPSGVIIVEYDADYMGASSWLWKGAPNYFEAIYYYGINDTEESGYLGCAAWLADTTAGCEEVNVTAAINAFTFAHKDTYIEPSVAQKYYRDGL